MPVMFILLVLVVLLVFGALAANIGHPDHGTRNFVIGLVLGPIGVLIVAVLKTTDQSTRRFESPYVDGRGVRVR